ncbi:MAG: pantoate--beta-alanine ligase [Planctomycetia bacterium]|nr:pantoate--beta-alanine ligase [Planctomycetia bacterium]
MTPKVFSSRRELKQWTAQCRTNALKIGLVPTMGALHEGHLSLVDAALKKCDCAIVSIFVNPTQFAPNEDFDKYPRTLESDLARLAHLNSNANIVVFAPSPAEMYPEGFDTYVVTGGVALPLEGVARPTHFRGVATVVLKLFLLSSADCAFFGQKDFQQARVIEQMVRDLDVPIEIVVCPIVRESSGLALSSRNQYLSPDAKKNAATLFQSLQGAEREIRAGERSCSAIKQNIQSIIESVPQQTVEYIKLVHPETLEEQSETLTLPVAVLLAVRAGATRLIDNAIFS